MESEKMFAPDTEKYKGDFSLAVQLLEKFKFEKQDQEMDEALVALQSGEATMMQINMTLGELKSLRMRLDPRDAQPWRVLPNEAELPQQEGELNKAITQLEKLMDQIHASRGTDIIGEADRDQ